MKNKLVATLMVSVFLISILSIAVPIIPTSASPTEIRVPEDYATIQAAVNAASSGDIINVGAGTYAGAIVDKNVTILGGRDGKSTITSGVPYKVGSSYYTAFRLDGNADGAKIKNFTISCDSTVKFYFAVFSRSADGVIIDSLTVNDAVQGITNYGGSNWQITNNVLTNTEAAGGGGIAIYLGVYPPYYTVCSGNLVQNNTITATATAPDYTCPGISLGVDMRGLALDVLTGNEDMSNNQILNNTITAPGALNGVGIEIGVIGLGGDPTKIDALLGTIHDNTVKGNTIDGADMGVYLYTVTKLKIQQNEIKNCNEGIHIKDGSDGNTIISNNIVNNVIGLNMSARAQVSSNTIKGGRVGIWLGPGPYSTSSTVKGNTIKDFIKAGIVNRGSTNFIFEGNTISTTIHDEAPNGIDIGIYTGAVGTVKDNKISGCSWKDFTGDYDTSWSGSGILVIESGDSLEILGNIVYECDVGMDIESDSMKITCNNVYDNTYGFVFWNAKPKVNYNNIYSNTLYGVYRTALGDLTGVLDARYNWWGDPTGPYHATNPSGLGNAVSDNVNFNPWLFAKKVPPLVHNVAIIEITINATMVLPGDTGRIVQRGKTIKIDVTAKNKGTAYENFTVTIIILKYDESEEAVLPSQNVDDLAPGHTRPLTFYWDTTGVEPVGYMIRAIASTVPGERYIDTYDNSKAIVVTIAEQLPSIPVVRVVPAYKEWLVRGSFTLNVTIENVETFWDMGGFSTMVTYNSSIINAINATEGPFLANFGDTYGWFEINNDVGYVLMVALQLPPKSTTSGSGILFTIEFKGVGEGECDVKLQSIDLAAWPDNAKWVVFQSVLIPYTSVGGHIKIVRPLVGDINADGQVSLADLVLLAKAYGSRPGDSNWNPYADIAEPWGVIGLTDLVTVGFYYAHHFP